MPIYEYECRKCGKFEVIQKITEEPLKACEKCGKPVRRLVSLSSFNLVGGGWYKDLYSSTNNKKNGKSEGSSNASNSSSSSTSDPKPAKADTKPAAKTETKPTKPTTAAA